ncbi:MAG TPA: hypothetical protein VI792_03285 [Candidatus Eisenbacteria bacterium]
MSAKSRSVSSGNGETGEAPAANGGTINLQSLLATPNPAEGGDAIVVPDGEGKPAEVDPVEPGDADVDTDVEADEDTETDATPNPVTPKKEKTPPAKSKMQRFLDGEADARIQTLLDNGDALELTDEQWDALPIEAQIAFAAARQRGMAAQAELAKQEQARRTADEALKRREQQALEVQADAFKAFRDPKLKEYLDSLVPKGPLADADTEEGLQQRMDAAFVARQKEWLAKLMEADAAVTKTAEQAKATTKLEAERAELSKYIAQFPEDFAPESESYKEIRELVQASSGKITAQRAHELVMARRALAEDDDAKAQLTARARKAVQPGGRAGRPIPRLPEGLSIEEELAWYQRHPEAEARDRAEAQRRAGYDSVFQEQRKARKAQ